MAWARKRTQNRGHPNTRRDSSAPAWSRVWPTRGQARAPVPEPSAPTGALGHLLPWAPAGLGLSGTRTIWAFGTQAAASLSPINGQTRKPRPERGSALVKVTRGVKTPSHSPRGSCQTSDCASEEAESSENPLSPVRVPVPHPEPHSGNERSRTVPGSTRLAPAPTPRPYRGPRGLRPLTQAVEQQPQGQDGPQAAPHVFAGGSCCSPQPRPGAGARSMPCARDECRAGGGVGAAAGGGRGRERRKVRRALSG